MNVLTKLPTMSAMVSAVSKSAGWIPTGWFEIDAIRRTIDYRQRLQVIVISRIH